VSLVFSTRDISASALPNFPLRAERDSHTIKEPVPKGSVIASASTVCARPCDVPVQIPAQSTPVTSACGNLLCSASARSPVPVARSRRCAGANQQRCRCASSPVEIDPATKHTICDVVAAGNRAKHLSHAQLVWSLVVFARIERHGLRKLIRHRPRVTTTKVDGKRNINLLLKLPLPTNETRLLTTWIHLLKRKKRFQFADKSIVWKDAFPHCWEVPLPRLQARHGLLAAATFRRQRERSSRQPQKLAGRG
jgi:hypothetical protein